jgi:hypothetical protein
MIGGQRDAVVNMVAVCFTSSEIAVVVLVDAQ